MPSITPLPFPGQAEKFKSNRLTRRFSPAPSVPPPEVPWPDRFIVGVHSIDPQALIIPNTPEALQLGARIFEKQQRRLLHRRPCRPAAEVPLQNTPLVSNSISHRYLPEYVYVPSGRTTHYEVYARDLYLCRHDPATPPPEPPDGLRGTINQFSEKSQARLKHRCDNSGHRVRSQYLLTYHNQGPKDGKEAKAHLNSFLKVLKRAYPGIGYIWVLEFQVRGVPHFHIFLTVPPDEQGSEHLALAWVRITKGTEEQLKRHLFHSWIPWEMASSNYVLKEYCTKIAQKDVPPEYQNVGRFWGNSRNMNPVPEIYTPEQIAATTTESNVIPWEPSAVERYINRQLRKWQERQMNRTPDGTKRKQRRKKKASMTRQESEMNGRFKIRNGTKILKRLIHYMQFNSPDLGSLKVSNREKIPF